MQQAIDPAGKVLEVLVTRHAARFGEPVAPVPPRFGNDASSTAWEISESSWSGGAIVVVWVRRTMQPLQASPMVDEKPPEPVVPAPGLDAVLSSEEQDLQHLGRLLGVPLQDHPVRPIVAAQVATAPSSVLAPPPSVPVHFDRINPLPHYASERAPLASQQNVTVRGGVRDVQAPVSPVYAPPPLQPSVPGVPGLYDVELKPCSAPVPPLPSPPAPNTAQASATVAVQPRTGVDPHGASVTPSTAPPRAAIAETFPNMTPIDPNLFPGAGG
jgi:hypothetical protein